ncbi:MAG: bifunctional oligoribonuclease/PAP phosphatase NrnA [Acidobacteria bacterium]|nr:bifunctional oligoribonuclease/PAP phosphatase NrnA [Acidobacteriota bacterium]
MSEMTPEAAALEVATRIRNGSNFLITSHRNPDGDAIGSALALQGIIRKLGKTATVIVRDDFGKPLHRIPGADGVLIADALPADYPDAYDALFTMECPEHERTGFPVLPGPVINIDHHLGNTLYGEVNFLDLDAPSVGEMVLQMNRHLGVEIDADIATAMYVSLATDTGFFRYSNTTMRAFEGAQEMIRAGADPAAVSLWINESLPLSSIKLLGLCLNTLKMFDDGRIATLELTNSFLSDAQASKEDAEGVVNYGRMIDGVLVSAMFKEVEGGTRISMRAKPGVDVQKIAASFGGGGHKAAAGCFIPKPIEGARETLIPMIEDAVKGVTPS